MAKRDVLDIELAKQFAWRTAGPQDLADVTGAGTAKPSPPALTQDEQAAAEQQLREQIGRRCADLAEHVARAWRMTQVTQATSTTSLNQQAAATVALFERVRRLSYQLVGMQAYPLESIRLWRLIIRHCDRLPSRGRREGLDDLTFLPVSLQHRESADLLVESAEAGNEDLAFSLAISIADDTIGRRFPGFGARLACILDEGKTWAARRIAAQWLSLVDGREAIASLRRALLQPHARLRWTALELLLRTKSPAAIQDDILRLLEDAVIHPLPCGDSMRQSDVASDYANLLLAAVRRVRPPEGWRPLETIADGDGVHLRSLHGSLDDGWALQALAAGYPERALTRIDRRLWSTRTWQIYDALEAAALLPAELARPRLLEAASIPHHRLAERAKQLWFKLFGETCPATPFDGVPVEILSAPPSDRFLSGLTVLRGSVDEAKGAMLEAMLAVAPTPADDEEGAPPDSLTAPQREALALLLFSLRDGSSRPRRAGLPSTEEKWAELLIRRFGEPAFTGIATLAARGALAGVDHEWLSALASLARTGVLTPPRRDRLRDIASDVLRQPEWAGSSAPLVALTYVGAPPDLLDRLFSIAVGTPTGGEGWAQSQRMHAAYWAANVLVAMKDAPALDARITSEGSEALCSRAFGRFVPIMEIGCRRGVPRAFELAERCLAMPDDDQEVENAAARCVYALAAAGRLDDAWLLDVLSRPESPRFTIAARQARGKKSPAALDALHRALESTARDGASAAEAAATLVYLSALAPADARLDGILERAAERARGVLAGMLVSVGAPLAPLVRHVMDLLVSPDAEASGHMFEDLYAKEPDGIRELLEAALAKGTSASIRSSIERYLDRPGEADLYWRDGGEGEDADEDEGDYAYEDEDEDEDEDTDTDADGNSTDQ